MSGILESLFYGNLCPDESIHPNTPEYLLLNKKISSTIEAYQKKLSTEEFDELEKLMDLLGQSTSIYSATSYSHGFRMGALMMVEVFGGEEELVQKKI